MTVERAATNTVASNLLIETTTTGGAGANGIGASIWLRAQDALGAVATAGKIISTWVDAAIGNSNVQLTTKLGGTESVGFTLNPNSSITLNEYGAGTFTGDVAYGLAVDVDGNVIETTASSSALVYTARISGSFAGGVSLIEIENTTGATFTINALLAGYYEIGCSNSALFNRDNAVIFGTLSDGTPRVFTATIAALTAAITIQTLDFSGAPADGINLAMIKIEIYP
jgi:hypothetical protein